MKSAGQNKVSATVLISVKNKKGTASGSDLNGGGTDKATIVL